LHIIEGVTTILSMNRTPFSNLKYEFHISILRLRVIPSVIYMRAGRKTLAKKVEDIVGSAPGHLGVSIRLAGHGPVVEIDSHVQFPLASVYKVPLLATLFHKIDAGQLSLDEQVILREIDKSLGSGDLQYFRSGARLTVHDLCHLMIVHSDNTATDMIHRLIGLEAPNIYMRKLGLSEIDIYCPGREYFYIFLGWAKQFRGKSLGEITASWKRMSRQERVASFERIRNETRTRSVAEAQKLAIELWGISDEKETKEIRDASAVIDNYGSPGDVATLLERIVTNKVAPRGLTEQMIDYMALCDSREMIPAKIPEGVRVANKTGGVPGTVNDSAIIFASKRNTILCACFSKDVKYADRKVATAAIAQIGLAAYESLK
jgi:beta-lactamase class A